MMRGRIGVIVVLCREFPCRSKICSWERVVVMAVVDKLVYYTNLAINFARSLVWRIYLRDLVS